MVKMKGISGLDRRQLLALASGAAIASFGLAGSSKLLHASETAGQKSIASILNGRKPISGGIKLDAPAIAENGGSVPVSFIVDSPMLKDDYVKSVHVIAESNPLPLVATFHFSPLSGRATSFTRIRLAKTQNVSVIAEMSDGSLRQARAQVKVTVGGCAPAK